MQPYTSHPEIIADSCGAYTPLPKFTLPAPQINTNFFGRKPECERDGYNPRYGLAEIIVPGHNGAIPVDNRPPYFVVAYIIRIK